MKEQSQQLNIAYQTQKLQTFGPTHTHTHNVHRQNIYRFRQTKDTSKKNQSPNEGKNAYERKFTAIKTDFGIE